MACTEAYKEHITYTFHGFCKVVIRNAAITAWRDQQRRHKREISLEYLTEEKHYPLGTSDEYFTAPYEEYPVTICGQTIILTNGKLAAALLSLPEKAIQMTESGELSAGHARALLPLAEKLSPEEFEKLLEDICSTTENGLNFIVDREGILISCAGSDRVGKAVYEKGADEAGRRAAYRQIARETGLLGETDLSIYSVRDERTGWEIVRVTSQEELIQALRQQQQLRIFIIVLSLCAVMAIMFSQVTKMTGSINKVVETMRKAGKGELGIHVEKDPKRPTEIEVIAEEFNSMMDKLKQSTQKQKDAEIAALEAQINPHFLYNTLDTINWMAIDRDEYEISNMIAALAGILRYGISDSNGVVKIKDEADWLKQYIFLQQTKLKNSFDCHINVEPEIMGLPIHKLLLQPFVENAILHGFEGIDGTHKLQMDMGREGERITIRIQDNGCGMPAEMVREMNAGIFRKTDNKNHIGMENAITRIHMYYGGSAEVKIESQTGQGTTVRIWIPVVNGSDREEADREE